MLFFHRFAINLVKLIRERQRFVFFSVESSDDDKIVSYKWEETKGPISSHGKLESVGAHKPILQLKNLEAGKYTFR